MGARTLVAVEGPERRYDCYHSQWGGEHLEWLLKQGPLDDGPTGLVDEEPTLTGIPADRVLSVVESRTDDALVVQAGDDRVEAYVVCRLDIVTGPGPDPGNTRCDADQAPMARICRAIALVPWTDATAAARLRRLLRIGKGILGDAVDAGLIPAWLASAYLGVRLARISDAPDRILWYGPAMTG